MSKIGMLDIPFAPVDLCDTIPPVKPPAAPAPYKRPKAHSLVAWRDDGGGLQTWHHDTLEAAQSAAKSLSWVVYWKYAIQCGRDLVERGTIDAPADYVDAYEKFQASMR